MTNACVCVASNHLPRLVVLTGGPGAGKTAVLEVVRRELCKHVIVLPEVASMLWLGGFPRRPTLASRRAAQRAIVRVQQELQRGAFEEREAALILCDRGTLDGLAYWPGAAHEFFSELGTTREAELARYATVIHLRPPTAGRGYRSTEVRIETAEQAASIDDRITQAWAGHRRQFVVESDDDFLVKLQHVIELIRRELPPCCQVN